MPGTYSPAQMFDHELNVVKGWPSPYAVDKTKKVIDADRDSIIAGRVVCIDPTEDKFKLGTYMDSTSASMPCFAWPSSTDLDVRSDVGNISGGNLTALPASGAYEFETTEFMGTGFDPNIPLTVSNTADANKGKVLVTTLGAATLIVGIVSDKGVLTNENKKSFVRFWPVYLPRRP